MQNKEEKLMKKLYTSPEFTAEELLRVDVITASGDNTTPGENQKSVTENAYKDITDLL